jgi:holo-[acyl-carrier protein] synthase
MIPAWEDGMTEAPGLGVGIDLVSVARVERMLERWGTKFLKRVFTDGEIAYCTGKAWPASSLAARFAAKEAFYKAVSGWSSRGMGYRSIEVVAGGDCPPGLSVHGPAKEALGALDAALSISHDGGLAVAIVVVSPEVKA